jgi:hypothetical protein
LTQGESRIVVGACWALHFDENRSCASYFGIRQSTKGRNKKKRKGMCNKKQLEQKTVGRTTQHQFWEKEVATESRRRKNSWVLNQQAWIRLYIYGINMIVKGFWGWGLLLLLESLLLSFMLLV